MNKRNSPANFWSMDYDSKREVQRTLFQYRPPVKVAASSKPKVHSAHRKSFASRVKFQQRKGVAGRPLTKPKPILQRRIAPIKKPPKPKKQRKKAPSIEEEEAILTTEESESLRMSFCSGGGKDQNAAENKQGTHAMSESAMGDTESELVHEMAAENLIDIQQREALDLVVKGRLGSINDVIAPKLYSNKFQAKVSQYLIDGGKLSIASERLNIHPDVLKSWKRNYLQVQKERRANMKKMKGKNYVTLIQRCPPSSVKKLTQFLPQKYSSKAATVAKTNSSLNARKIAQKSIFKSIQRVKQRSVSPRTISSSKEQVFMGKHYDDIRVETGNSSSKIEKNSAKQKPDLPPKKLGYILEPSADPNFRENFYVIFDKGASEMSSSDAATEPDFLSDGQAFLAGGQRVVPKDVSLFVCEGCRQIFRFSNTFKSHMKSFCAIPQKDEKRQIFL